MDVLLRDDLGLFLTVYFFEILSKYIFIFVILTRLLL